MILKTTLAIADNEIELPLTLDVEIDPPDRSVGMNGPQVASVKMTCKGRDVTAFIDGLLTDDDRCKLDDWIISEAAAEADAFEEYDDD